MRLLLIAIVTLSLGIGAPSAQTGIVGSPPSAALPGSPPPSPATLKNPDFLPPLRLLPIATPTGISPQRQSSSGPRAGQGAHDIAVADCMQMWDSGTHMTKQEWSRTCTRVQTRLDSLNVDAIVPKTKKQVR
jgi:hypothetical protein